MSIYQGTPPLQNEITGPIRVGPLQPSPSFFMSYEAYTHTIWKAAGNKGRPPKWWVKAFVEEEKKRAEEARANRGLDDDDEYYEDDEPTPPQSAADPRTHTPAAKPQRSNDEGHA